MISIALSLLLLKEGARCRSINHTLYAQIANIHSYDTQEMAHYIVSMKYILIYVIGVFFYLNM